MAQITKDGVIEFLEKMSILEMNDFVQELQDKWGVTAAAPVAAVAGAPAGVTVEEEVEQTVTLPQSVTSIPMLLAVPAIIRLAASISVVLRSCSFIRAIFST